MITDPLVWIDLEMTGLDVDRDVIVEIAILVTDSNLEIVDAGLDLVIHQPDEVLASMNNFVRDMHTRSGLLAEIQQSTVTFADAAEQSLSYIKQFVPNARTVPMCGNTIGMDRRFLSRYMNELDEWLHYRSIDVSSLKELCRRWYPEVYRKRPSKRESHRALDDIRESISELRFYRSEMLLPITAASGDALDATNKLHPGL